MAETSNKRKDLDEEEEVVEQPEKSQGAIVVKKQKTDNAIVASSNNNNALISGIQRTSSLQAPIMLLTGHKADVFTAKFSPSGQHLASGSFDKMILLWNTYGDCDNYMALRGHQNAVLDLHWSTDGRYIFSASADKTVQVWDVEEGQRIKKLAGHSSFVNSCCPARRGPPLVLSGSDDGNTKLWDARVKQHIETYHSAHPVTAVCFNDTSDQIFSAGTDNDIKIWDLRNKKEVLMKLEGHEDTVTGVRLSPDGSYLLTNAMDNTVRIWDVRPFVKGHRNIKIFQGIQHNYEKTLLRCAWSPDGSKISAGSADRFVYIWDTASRRILYKLPGHRGSVNEVDFHPKEPIVASCSNDQTIYLGEIKP